MELQDEWDFSSFFRLSPDAGQQELEESYPPQFENFEHLANGDDVFVDLVPIDEVPETEAIMGEIVQFIDELEAAAPRQTPTPAPAPTPTPMPTPTPTLPPQQTVIILLARRPTTLAIRPENCATTAATKNLIYSPLPDLALSPLCSSVCSESGGDDNCSDGSLTPGSPAIKLQCPWCQKTFMHQRGFKRHWKGKHSQSAVSFPCRICQKPLKSLVNRQRHEKSHVGPCEQGDLKGFRMQCQVCSKLFWDRTLFQRHQTVHSEERPFSCHLCPLGKKRFKVKSSLTNHLKTVHVSEFENGTDENCLQ